MLMIEYFDVYSVNNTIYEIKMAVGFVNLELNVRFNSVSLITPTFEMRSNTDKVKFYGIFPFKV